MKEDTVVYKNILEITRLLCRSLFFAEFLFYSYIKVEILIQNFTFFQE